jgi:hypothetical protein
MGLHSHAGHLIMKKYLFALVALTIALSGCAVYTPAGSVVVDPAGPHGHPRGDGQFCPPGQAKKGNC